MVSSCISNQLTNNCDQVLQSYAGIKLLRHAVHNFDASRRHTVSGLTQPLSRLSKMLPLYRGIFQEAEAVRSMLTDIHHCASDRIRPCIVMVKTRWGKG